MTVLYVSIYLESGIASDELPVMWAGFDGIEFDSVDNDGNLLYVENTDAA